VPCGNLQFLISLQVAYLKYPNSPVQERMKFGPPVFAVISGLFN
jgi:hypothetical protein